MASEENKKRTTRIAVRVAGLAVSPDKQPEFEKSLEDMADMADSLGYLDPLDAEPGSIFDPRVRAGG